MVRCIEKIVFKFFLLFAIEMAILSVFSQRKGLGPIGVNYLHALKMKFASMVGPHEYIPNGFEVESFIFYIIYVYYMYM